MSFAAIKWAMEQPVAPALTKFCLVAMAECVNAEDDEAVCWPSYSHLCQRTGMNTKTVEKSVYALKQEGYIVDTGRRAGGTGKVIVYRLNTTKSGGVVPGTLMPSANGTRPQNDTKSGGVIPSILAAVIPPNLPANPPKFADQSPQISQETPPKTGDGTSKGIRKGTRKEPEGKALPRPADVAEQVWSDWLSLRAKKRASVSETVLAEARRESVKAGLTLERFLAIWCLRGSQGLQADWLNPAERGRTTTTPSRNGGFRERDYTEGATDGVPNA